jgi:drug/metabolite transporter (DMT)-like permease
VALQELVLLLTSIVLGVVGQFFLKSGALKLGKVSVENALSHILGIATTPELVGGLVFYGLGAITYILLLTRVSLSIVGPATALSYVFSVVLGFFFFREIIPLERLIGLGLIVCGVILVLWQRQ